MITLTLIKNDGLIGSYTWLCKWYLDKVPRNSCSFSNGTWNIFWIWGVLNKDSISSFRNKTLPNAQRTRGLSSDYLQNLDQASTSKIWPNISISSKLKTSKSWPNLASESRPRLNCITTTKHQQQNNDQTLASKSWPNLETLCSKSEQKLYFMTKLHLPNLQQTVVNTFLIININKSSNFNKFWVAIFTCQAHINQVN